MSYIFKIYRIVTSLFHYLALIVQKIGNLENLAPKFIKMSENFPIPKSIFKPQYKYTPVFYTSPSQSIHFNIVKEKVIDHENLIRKDMGEPQIYRKFELTPLKKYIVGFLPGNLLKKK